MCVRTVFPPGSSTRLGRTFSPRISTFLLALTNTLLQVLDLSPSVGSLCVLSFFFIALSYLLSQKSTMLCYFLMAHTWCIVLIGTRLAADVRSAAGLPVLGTFLRGSRWQRADCLLVSRANSESIFNRTRSNAGNNRNALFFLSLSFFFPDVWCTLVKSNRTLQSAGVGEQQKCVESSGQRNTGDT